MRKKLLRYIAPILAIMMTVGCENRKEIPDFSYVPDIPDIVQTESAETYAANAAYETATVYEPVTDDISMGISSGETDNSKDFLVTSNDPLNYARITFDGLTAVISGTYTIDPIVQIGLYDTDYTVIKFETEGNDFEGEVRCDAPSDGYCSVILYTKSGLYFDYRIRMTEDALMPITEGLPTENNIKVEDSPHNLTSEEIKNYIGGDPTDILGKVKEISDGVCEGIEDDYEKARALAMFVSSNIYYDFDAKENSVTAETISLSHVLETHRSVCGGFANLYSALCAAQGITCYNINGDCITDASSSYAESERTDGIHEWTALEIDGRRILVDTVWNTSNTYSNGEYYGGYLRTEFFDMTEETMAAHHRAFRCEYRDYFSLL